MPITTQWWVFADAIIESEQDAPGVYELGNAAGEVIYIGSSTDLRYRLKEHWNEPDVTCVKTKATQYRVEYRDNHIARERELHDEYLRTHGLPPPCNRTKS
jgi:predicted GIY-YIG superfamily endonuclease